MSSQLIEILSSKVNILPDKISNTIKLIKEGYTIPFITRFRKELTGGLDDDQISEIKQQYFNLVDVEKKKRNIISSIREQDKLTTALQSKIDNCYSIHELEDIYLPFKPKRRTRAFVARENGLEPLAVILLLQHDFDIQSKAKSFINEKFGDIDEVLQGARDIIAEMINENLKARNIVRNLFDKEANLSSLVIPGKEEIGQKFSNYFNFTSRLQKCPTDSIFEIRRGESEGILKVSIYVDEKQAIDELEKLFLKSDNESSEQVQYAIKESFRRLISSSIENEFARLSKEKADNEAIKVFSGNLKHLLLTPAYLNKRILAIVPGYNSGCKLVCLDEQSNLLHNDIIYPHKPHNETKQSGKKIVTAINAYKIDAIAIGNGTASRETEEFLQNLKFSRTVKIFIVSENVAAIYSTSPVGKEEFPLYSADVRRAISIGRRLADPLNEMVKVSPELIGVGQYQYDVNQNLLHKSLTETVESCLNLVGANINTAGKQTLSYISGLNPELAENIINYRNKNGKFLSRLDLKEVPGMNDKIFEQCSGFLKIIDGFNPLDNTSIHPESYHIVEKIAKDINSNIFNLLKNKNIKQLIDPQDYISEKVGIPTINDILSELERPGLDPRKSAKYFEFAKGINKIEDLRPGMILPGVVTKITNIAVYVDIGINLDGFIHISNLKNAFFTNPSEVVSLHQHVSVKVIEIDITGKKILLSLKDNV